MNKNDNLFDLNREMINSIKQNSFEMPTPCAKCGEIFDLHDGGASEKWFKDTTICRICKALEEKEIEQDELFEENNSELSDALWLFNDRNAWDRINEDNYKTIYENLIHKKLVEFGTYLQSKNGLFLFLSHEHLLQEIESFNNNNSELFPDEQNNSEWFSIYDRNNPIPKDENVLIKLESGKIFNYNDNWERENEMVVSWKYA